jgi:predicted CopG family antitoxin
MAQKTIPLTERAYNLLKREKKKGESFSMVIERLLKERENPWQSMQGKFDEELWEELEENVDKMRQQNLIGESDEE